MEVQDFCLLSADRLRGEAGDDWGPGHVDVVVLSALVSVDEVEVRQFH